MSKRHSHWEAHARERDGAKDMAFLASLRSLTEQELATQRRHYKKTPWRVVAIDRETSRRQRINGGLTND